LFISPSCRLSPLQSREAVPGDEEGWESNSDDGAGGHDIKKTSSTSKVAGGGGGGRARSSSTSSRKVSNNDGAHHPPGPTPVQRGAADRKAAGAMAMFRIHSSSSDLLQTQTNGVSPKRQSFVVPSSSSNGPPLPLSREHEEGGGLPTPPITSSPPPSSPDPEEEAEAEVDPIPTPTSRRQTIRPASSSSSLSAQLLRHASVTNANGLHHSITSPSPASVTNRAAAPSTTAASTLASIPQQRDHSPPRKVYSDVQLANQGSDRSSSSNDLSIHPRRQRTTSGHFNIHAPSPQINPPAQLLTTQPNLHPTPPVPAADPHPSPPSSVDTATIVGADEPQQHHHEGDSYAFPTTVSPASNGHTSAHLPHHQQPSFPSIRGPRPPPLRTASSRSSLNSFTGASRNFAPRRLVSVTSNGPTTAPPQLSSDYASANPPVDPRSGWPVSASPETDTQSLRAVRPGVGGGEGDDAMGHLRKASFSSLRGGASPYGKMGNDLREGRDRTTSMASLRSAEGAYDTDSRSGGGRFGGAASAMASLRSSTDIPSEFTSNPRPHGRSRLTSSSSSTSLAEGLKRSIIGGLAGAAAQFLPSPSSNQPPNSSPTYGHHPQRAVSMFSTQPPPPSASSSSSTTNGSISTLHPNFSTSNLNPYQPPTNVALVSHFQREQPSSLSNSETNWEREERRGGGEGGGGGERRTSLHPSPFLENHRALLKGMATSTKGGGGGKAGGGRHGKGGGEVGGAAATPMGLSVRRCLALR